MPAVGVAVFFAAERTGNVVSDGCDLQNELGFPVQMFQFPQGPGIGPDPNEVVDVVQISLRERDHLFHELRYARHGKYLLI